MRISDSRIADLLRPYGVNASVSLCGQIGEYTDLLLRWNQKISLTTVVEPEEIVRFHFGESFFGAPVGSIGGGRLADLGSGPGFPGIPLKMLIPSLSLTLIESNSKKATFLSEVCRRLSIREVQIYKKRFQEVDEGEKFSIVASRAVGSFPEIAKWAKSHLTAEGKLLLWANSSTAEELSEDFAFSWERPSEIPLAKDRLIIQGVLR